MRRELTATNPLAPSPANQLPPPNPPQSSNERVDYSTLPPARTAPSVSMSPDESAENLLKSFASKCRKLPLDPSAVPVNLNGLQILARSFAWKHVIELSNKIIDSNTESEISLSTRLRLEGLFRLKMFDDLSSETSMLLSTLKNKILDESEDTPRIRNSIYAMQLLLSETKAMTGNGEDAFQDLYQLRGEIDQQSDDCKESATLPPSKWWSWRVTSIIVNAAIRQRIWRVALAELRGLLNSIRAWHKRASTSESSSSSRETSGNFRRVEVVILCRLSRILLQIGAMDSSKLYYKEAMDSFQVLTTEPGYVQKKSDVYRQLELTKGLMLFGEDQYEGATEIFLRIIEDEKNIRVTATSDTHSVFDSGPVDGPSLFWKVDDNSSMTFRIDSAITLEDSVLSAAVNNYAICALYLRRIKEAIECLEELIKDDPLTHLIDPIVFNLCTLYDLSCSPDVSVIKKMLLQKLSVKYHVDDPMLHWRSFRLN